MAPVRITAENGPWPLHDTDASRAAESAGLAATAPHALMQRAGFGVARFALARFPHARRVAIVAGPGNNGGDGLVAATHLHRAGLEVRVGLLGDPDRMPDDAAAALRVARDSGVALAPSHDLRDAGLVIDALLGLGMSRPAEGAIADAVRAIEAAARPVLAVDLPTGLDADRGEALGALAVHAQATLSLLTLKPGLFTHEGRDHAGEVWFDDLGVALAPASAELAGVPPPRPRPHASHKGRFGDVAVVGGAAGMAGAAWLAARAALAAGAGRVYVSPLDDESRFDPARPELMRRPDWWRSPPPMLAATAVVCGCGGGDAVRTVLPPLIAHAGSLVLDADALNAVATDSALQALLRSRGARGAPTVLTPHPLEAARLLGTTTAQVQGDRLTAARRLAGDSLAVVVLKGSGSIVAAPGVLPSINPTGSARLSTPGTGDVLAGAIGAWLARGVDARRAAIEAVWRHGRTADLAPGTGPVRAADLADALAG